MIGILGLRMDERSRLEWMQDGDADFRSAWPHTWTDLRRSAGVSVIG
ncbi:Uncharacterized protein pbN1_19680 [Aromatoleum bremense]|nr:Uncharacterized protein pbN1_19680 [Aromatoleum bremense]